jgi:hypothetical protein
VGVLKYPATDTTNLKIPFGGNSESEIQRMIRDGFNGKDTYTFKDALPYTGRGYTGSGIHNIPEYRYTGSAIDGEALDFIPDGTEIYEYTKTGHPILVATYDRITNKFIRSY